MCESRANTNTDYLNAECFFSLLGHPFVKNHLYEGVHAVEWNIYGLQCCTDFLFLCAAVCHNVSSLEYFILFFLVTEAFFQSLGQ